METPLRMKAAGINAVMNNQNSLLGNPVDFDEFSFRLIADRDDFATVFDLQVFDAHYEAMIEADRVPELSENTAVFSHLFQQEFSWASAASKNVLGKDAVEAHDDIAIVRCDHFRSEDGKGQSPRASRPREAGHTMAAYAMRNGNLKLLAE